MKRGARPALQRVIFVIAAGFWGITLGACQSGSQAFLPLVRPVEGGWVSAGFGLREQHPVLGFSPGRIHAGFDFAVAEGTPVRATRAGVVRTVAVQGGYGKLILIDHQGGYASLYGHLREWWVQAGQVVAAGAPIAAVGRTGLSTGPHLHYEWLKDGRPIDPGSFDATVSVAAATQAQVPSQRGLFSVVEYAAPRGLWALLASPERPARTGD